MDEPLWVLRNGVGGKGFFEPLMSLNDRILVGGAGVWHPPLDPQLSLVQV